MYVEKDHLNCDFKFYWFNSPCLIKTGIRQSQEPFMQKWPVTLRLGFVWKHNPLTTDCPWVNILGCHLGGVRLIHSCVPRSWKLFLIGLVYPIFVVLLNSMNLILSPLTLKWTKQAVCFASYLITIIYILLDAYCCYYNLSWDCYWNS